MKKSWITINIIFVFLILFSINLVFSQPIVDQKISDSLNERELVEVIVGFKQVNNTFYSVLSGLERELDHNLKEESNLKLQSDIIASLNKDEFNLTWTSSNGGGFSGYINQKGLDKLINNPNVAIIHLPYLFRADLSESLPLINATNIWVEGYTGEGQTICIIDSGVNYTHPNLGGCAYTNNISDGSCGKVIGGWDFVNNDANPIDDFGHGTHVAGIVAANGTINGTAPSAKIVAVKVLNSSGRGSNQDVISGIEWCNNNRDKYNISIITMSLGSDQLFSDSLSEDICDPDPMGVASINAYNNGIFIDAASGNNGKINLMPLPACVSKVVSVGATYDANVGNRPWCTQKNSLDLCIEYCFDETTYQDKIVCLTNHGSNLDLLAPGAMISSTSKNGGTETMGGTSMAVPHVAGVVALLLERDPTLTPDKIKKVLKDTGKNISTNWQRIDAKAAIDSLCTCTAWTEESCGVAGGCSENDRKFTRTCNPSGCNTESKCVADTSCISAATTITVCQSGCDYTTIQGAVDASDTNDKIKITDSTTYNEHVVMDSTSSPWLECQARAKIKGTSGIGVLLNNVDGPVIINCHIEGFSRGIYLNSSYGIIKNNTLIANSRGVYLENEQVDNDILNNTINNSGDYGIDFDASSWGDSAVENKIFGNIFTKNTIKGIWFEYGQDNVAQYNNISGSTGSDGVGVHLDSHSNNAFTEIDDNVIYNNYIGVFFDTSSDNVMNSNIFCSSNSNKDIEIQQTSSSLSGDNNRCEIPGSWSDSGTTGCTFFCDNPPSVILLDPLDNVAYPKGNVDFTCYGSDDGNLNSLTLYHNITGTWQANETKSVTGLSNLTTFSISNIQNGAGFIWNCLASDSNSRSNFASENWTATISIPFDNAPNVTLINPLNASVSDNGTVQFSCLAYDEFMVSNITLYGDWNGGWHANETLEVDTSYNYTYFTKNLPSGSYKWNCLAYDNSSQSDWYEENWTFSINTTSTPPNDTYKFYIRNSLGNNVSWFGSEGNIVLKGSCFAQSTCITNDGSSFIIGNATDSTTAFINSTGDLCIEKGDCSDLSVSCNPTSDAFIIKNSSSANVAYIDYNGDLCLIGGLYKNSNP